MRMELTRWLMEERRTSVERVDDVGNEDLSDAIWAASNGTSTDIELVASRASNDEQLLARPPDSLTLSGGRGTFVVWYFFGPERFLFAVSPACQERAGATEVYVGGQPVTFDARYILDADGAYSIGAFYLEHGVIPVDIDWHLM
jgi:hypothetical protein